MKPTTARRSASSWDQVRVGSLGVAVAVAVLLIPTLLFPLSPYDGGLSASAGTFLRHGELPYRDFWWLYGPMSPALMGLLSSIFGSTVLLSRVAGIASLAAAAAAGHALLRRTSPSWLAALLPVVSTVVTAFVLGSDITSWAVATPIALCALVALGRAPDLLVGVSVGLAFLARLDIGGYALVAILLVRPRRSIVVGFALVAIPFAAVAFLMTSPSDLLQQLIWFPLLGTRTFRATPAPTFGDVYDFLLIFCLAIGPKVAILWALARLTLDRSSREMSVIAFVVFAGLTQLQTAGRGDLSHQSTAASLGLMTLAVVWRGARLPVTASRIRRSAELTAFAFVMALAFTAALYGSFSVARARTDASEDDAALIATVRTVVANTPPSAPLFVGLSDHRYTIWNSMLVYYLADRPSGTWATMFNPGVTNTAAVQQRMVAELESSRTPLLVLDEHNARAFEGANESSIPGSQDLDAYIASAYRRSCTIGSYELWVPKDAADVTCKLPSPISIWDAITRDFAAGP